MIIARTPLRISFFGGGTDIPAFYKTYGCTIVGTAINKYTYALVLPRWDRKIWIEYNGHQEVVQSIDEIKHDLIREAARMTHMGDGFEVKTLASIPSEGSGLGSSSSITLSLLNAFHTYQGNQVSHLTMIKEAIAIEIEILQKPIGIQDHYLCALGGSNRLYIDPGYDPPVDIMPLPFLKEEEPNLHLFYTGIARKAEDILNDQVSQMTDHLSEWQALRDVSNMHSPFWNKLYMDWEIKKKLSDKITTPGIDYMCNLAMSGGAMACKLLGAGGGGYLLVYCYPHDYQHLKSLMKDYLEMPFRFEPYGSKIILNCSD